MEEVQFKKYRHCPPHLFVPNTKYFITGATYQRKHLLINDESKIALYNSILKEFTDYNWQLEDWVILNNHYHIMVTSPDNPSYLNQIIKEIHRFNALWVKKNIIISKNNEAIWYNYWDSCITYETSYYSRLNYIWYNPVKHGYVESAEEWKHGSFYTRFKEENEQINKIKIKYPFDRLKIDDEF